MDLIQNFDKLSIQEERPFVCSLNDSLNGPWAQLTVSKTEGTKYSVGDFIELVFLSQKYFATFRIKSVVLVAKSQNSVSISKASGSLFGLTDGESVSIRLFTPSKVLESQRILLSDTITERRSDLYDLLRQHELFKQDQFFSSGHRITSINFASLEKSAIYLVSTRTEITDRNEASIISEQESLGKKRLWILNAKISDSAHLKIGESMISIFPGDDLAILEKKIGKILDNGTSLTVIDCSGKNKNREITRLILKFDFVTHDPSKDLVESTKHSEKLDSWGKIAGYDALIGEIKSHVEALLKINSDTGQSGLSLAIPKGILLYGPPGCSKTMIARAIATCMGIEFISVKGPEIFSKWVGDSEKAISDVFSKARKLSPCVIFFDEFDSLGSSRSSEHKSAVESRVVAQLLSEIDGLSGGSKIIVVAATNRPDVIDPALLRPGRFDLHFHVPLPDADSRKKIIELNLSKSNLLEDTNLLTKLVEFSEGCSGAEVASGCRQIMISIIKGHDILSHLDSSLFARRI